MFRTSVTAHVQIDELKPNIQKEFPLLKWNFDLEDCDNIFRIESDLDITLEVNRVFNLHGYDCEEIG